MAFKHKSGKSFDQLPPDDQQAFLSEIDRIVAEMGSTGKPVKGHQSKFVSQMLEFAGLNKAERDAFKGQHGIKERTLGNKLAGLGKAAGAVGLGIATGGATGALGGLMAAAGNASGKKGLTLAGLGVGGLGAANKAGAFMGDGGGAGGGGAGGGDIHDPGMGGGGGFLGKAKDFLLSEKGLSLAGAGLEFFGNREVNKRQEAFDQQRFDILMGALAKGEAEFDRKAPVREAASSAALKAANAPDDIFSGFLKRKAKGDITGPGQIHNRKGIQS